MYGWANTFKNQKCNIFYSKLTTVHGKILGCIFDKHVISLKYFGSKLLRSLTINTQVHIRLGAIANIYLYTRYPIGQHFFILIVFLRIWCWFLVDFYSAKSVLPAHINCTSCDRNEWNNTVFWGFIFTVNWVARPLFEHEHSLPLYYKTFCVCTLYIPTYLQSDTKKMNPP